MGDFRCEEPRRVAGGCGRVVEVAELRDDRELLGEQAGVVALPFPFTRSFGFGFAFAAALEFLLELPSRWVVRP